jgi:hypothetical protein
MGHSGGGNGGGTEIGGIMIINLIAEIVIKIPTMKYNLEKCSK